MSDLIKKHRENPDAFCYFTVYSYIRFVNVIKF